MKIAQPENRPTSSDNPDKKSGTWIKLKQENSVSGSVMKN